MIVLPLFRFAARLNSQNPYETEIHNESWHINLYTNNGISNWHIWNIDPMKMKILPSFQFVTRLLTPNTRNSLVHNSWNEMEQCEKRAYSSSKCEKWTSAENKKTSS